MQGGKVYGPIVGFGIFGKYTAVEIPFKTYGLRWVNIWMDDLNKPSKGNPFAVPIRPNIPPQYLNVALLGPSECRQQCRQMAEEAARVPTGRMGNYGLDNGTTRMATFAN